MGRLAGTGTGRGGTALTPVGATKTGGAGNVPPRLGVAGVKVGIWAIAVVGMATAQAASKLK